MSVDFSGVITAIVTPFKDGNLDRASLKKLVRHQLDAGVDGLVLSGTTGESPSLSSSEKKELFEVVKTEVGGQVPLIFGTGSNNTTQTIKATKEAEGWGVDAALVVVPYYNKPPQQGLVAHFSTVAKNTSLPVLLYNVPGRTVISLSVESISELSKVSNIVGIKEASADSAFAREIAKACGPEFLITSGDDGAYLDVAEAGGRGVISVLSHVIPVQMKELLKRRIDGDETSQEEFKKFSRLTELLFAESNPIPVKSAMQMMGVIDEDEVRLPLVPITPDLKLELKNELETLGLLP